MFNMKNAIGWIGNVAVLRIGDRYILLDVITGKHMDVK